MIRIILTTNIIEPLQVILLLVVFALLVGVFIANRIILRRMHRHAKQSKFANQVMQEALKNSQNIRPNYMVRCCHAKRLLTKNGRDTCILKTCPGHCVVCTT